MKTEKLSAFHRWLAGAPAATQQLVSSAADSLVGALAVDEFKLVRVPFDGSGAHGNAIDLERTRGELTDFILIVFDKHFRLRFQVRLGTKGALPPHPWIRSASMVWKSGSDSVRYQWWGVSWWNLRKPVAYIEYVNKILKIASQAHRYLNYGEVGTHIQEHRIAGSTQE